MSGSTTRTITKASSQVLVGGKVLLRMDGKLIGFANRATCEDDYSLEAIHIIGQLQAIDYVPTRASHRIELDMMVLRGDSLEKANIAPVAAGNFGFLDPVTNMGPTVGAVNSMKRDIGPVGADGSLRVLHGLPIDIDIIVPELPSSVTGTGGNGLTTSGSIAAQTVPVVVSYKMCFYDRGSLQFEANRVIGRRCTFYALDRRGWGMATEFGQA